MQRTFRHIIMLLAMTCVAQIVSAKQPRYIPPSYAWTMLQPLGLHEKADIDTLPYNYGQRMVPTMLSDAYATTGNIGAPGRNMIFFERKPMSDFFFRDSELAWLPAQNNQTFYNTRIPMTLLSYNTGGSNETSIDRLHGIFSGNVNRRLQVGAMVDYIYSKGSYEYQGTKDFHFGLSSSYMGDRFEYQTFFNQYNNLNKENGGITDDLYITDPAQLQGGDASIDPKAIPTNLTDSHNRINGSEFFFNGRYKIGFWQEDTVEREPTDTLDYRVYVPVTSFIWTLNYNRGRHVFDNGSSEDESTFWANHYISNDYTHDVTSYSSLRNTFGVALLEGFHKYAKFGLAAYVTHELRSYKQTPDTIAIGFDRPEYLTPYPYDARLLGKTSENLVWVGAQLTKQRGKILRYEATARLGLVGPAAGEIYASGNVSGRFRLFGDTCIIRAYGTFANESAPYLMNNYVSNHFIWHNDFGKIRRMRVGGDIDLPFSGTSFNVGVENIQNYIYFGDDCMPVQHAGSVQVFNATLKQNFRLGILNWRNRITYQTSTEESVIALPKIAVYSNLYLQFRVAKVLSVQLGVDCNYYTKYYAPGYQPSTMGFYRQNEVKVGNYPFMNIYANMRLSKARFYVMMSHFNQGLFGGENYFALPHYPMNQSRFQMGVSVDFAN